MQAFTWGKRLVEFDDFRGIIVRRERTSTPTGVRQDR